MTKTIKIIGINQSIIGKFDVEIFSEDTEEDINNEISYGMVDWVVENGYLPEDNFNWQI